MSTYILTHLKKFRRFGRNALQFLAGEFEQILEMARVPLLKQRIGQHLAQRRRNIHRQTRFRASLVLTLKMKISGR
ncbi:MAG: hypothetical protein IPJ30_23610 [Acidobacteria bacterium]|nr:hypothetical protein [Acidobacteriota bacterium]